MKVKKIEHSCIVIEEGNSRIMIDPGVYSPNASKERGVSAVLITHEHPDHLSIDIIKNLINSNVKTNIFTNSSVGLQLEKNSIDFTPVEEGDKFKISDINVEVFGKEHALIDTELERITNTSYLINNYIFHPGDALIYPKISIDTLAVPIMAPWARISEMLDYIREVKPKKVFPIHDGLLKEIGVYEKQAQRVCKNIGVEYIKINNGEEFEI